VVFPGIESGAVPAAVSPETFFLKSLPLCALAYGKAQEEGQARRTATIVTVFFLLSVKKQEMIHHTNSFFT